MGGTSYNVKARVASSRATFYTAASTDQIFEQNKKRQIHESMEPKTAVLREARDSAAHPNTVPIILGLDVTGSMGHIPADLIKTGLPKMMGGLIEHGVPDAALLFLAVGDTTVDHAPLQVGQFESGDVELDTWLTRTYIESGGGGNAGESYLLAWYYAAKHVETDAWDKRKKKGFLFTVGDEPTLTTLPKNVIADLMGNTPETGYTAASLLELAQEKWNVFHLHVLHGPQSRSALKGWKELMGQRCIEIDDYTTIPTRIAQIVTENSELSDGQATKPSDTDLVGNKPSPKDEIYL